MNIYIALFNSTYKYFDSIKPLIKTRLNIKTGNLQQCSLY